MSKYTTVKTIFKDGDCLLAALRTIYPATVKHEKAVNLVGYQGDKRDQTAEIVIPRNVKGGLGYSSNDLGFKQKEDGTWEALISEFDQSQVGKDFIDRVSCEYTESYTMHQALIQGLRFVQKTTNDLGEVELEFAVM